MGKIIGIDLGTTNSLVAIVESGIPLVLADGQGRRLTPSVVRVPAAGEPVVGWEAKRGRAVHPETTVTSIKRFMGRKFEDPGLMHGPACWLVCIRPHVNNEGGHRNRGN